MHFVTSMYTRKKNKSRRKFSFVMKWRSWNVRSVIWIRFSEIKDRKSVFNVLLNWFIENVVLLKIKWLFLRNTARYRSLRCFAEFCQKIHYKPTYKKMDHCQLQQKIKELKGTKENGRQFVIFNVNHSVNESPK